MKSKSLSNIEGQKALRYRIVYDDDVEFNYKNEYIIDFRSGFKNDSICIKYKSENWCEKITTDRSIDFASRKIIAYDSDKSFVLSYNNYSPIELNPEKSYKYVRIWYDIFKEVLFIEFSNKEVKYF